MTAILLQVPRSEPSTYHLIQRIITLILLCTTSALAVVPDPAGPGTVVPAGPGTTVLAGPGSDDGLWQVFDTADGLPTAMIFDVLQGRNGDLWIGTREGLCRYDGRTFTTWTTDDGLVQNSITQLIEDREGNLWMGTFGGVSRFDGQTFTNFTTADGQPLD